MQVLTAILDKLQSPDLLRNPSGVLDVMGQSMQTSISSDEIAELISWQLENGHGWDIERQAVVGTGDTQQIAITPQEVGTTVKLTITKQNYYRYERYIKTISAVEPYLIFNTIEINDAEGNGNHAPDYNETCHFSLGLHNAGFSPLDNFNVTLSCEHPAVEITQNTFAYNGMNISAMNCTIKKR